MSVTSVLVDPQSTSRDGLFALSGDEIAPGLIDQALFGATWEGPRILLLSAHEAKDVWTRFEAAASTVPLFPVVHGEWQESIELPLFLESAPVITSLRELPEVVRRVVVQWRPLQSELEATGLAVEPLVQNALCDWVKSQVGIVGRISLRTDEADMQRRLALLRQQAHETIDRVPLSKLSLNEVWNLLLVVRLPWQRDEILQKEQEWTVLREFISDVRGSRKLLQYADTPLASLLGPFDSQRSSAGRTYEDPFLDELETIALDPKELKALKLLFKRRFSATDLTALEKALGGGK